MCNTPYWNYTLDEVMHAVCVKEDPTDLEIEMLRRLEELEYERDYWKERAGGNDVPCLKGYSPEVKVEHA